MAGGSGHRVDYVRKGLIVAVLFGMLFLLYRYAVPSEKPDPTGLLALGFVVLAAYTIGELVEVIKLPHITGYLLAGMLLGPSISHTLPVTLPPPFDHGVLNEDVIGQLRILDILALPLICLTAGGALDIAQIRKAIRPILGILTGQTVLIFVGCIGLMWMISSGLVPFLTVPTFAQIAQESPAAIWALGGVLGAISLATSDAATIAIVVSTRARGPLTTNALSVAVIKDVLVVIFFSASTALALGAMPNTGGDASFTDSLVGIGLAVVLGVGLGGAIHLYLKYIGAELLLFLVGTIYTMSFVADRLEAESALMFIVAGFVAKNYSQYGDELISEVERLSMPVFVVFFTLAGAGLHLDLLVDMAAFGIALALVRGLALYVGCRIGAIVGGADEMSKKYVWLTYISQAGLAITLANDMLDTYDKALGEAMFSLILAGVVIHELIGPAALQYALGAAGEIPSGDDAHHDDAHDVPMSATAPVAERQGWRPSVADEENPWGPPPDLVATELASEAMALEERVQGLTRSVLDNTLLGHRRSADHHLRDLQQVFLREHRALLIDLRHGRQEAAHEMLMRLSERWRRLLHARSVGVESRAWDPMTLILALDRLAETTPRAKRVAVEPETLEPREEPRIRAMWRSILRALRRVQPP
ncbi:MAG: cation:proton antiporter, partial [Myxococcota bacterium]